jgi:hypothetical protein
MCYTENVFKLGFSQEQHVKRRLVNVRFGALRPPEKCDIGLISWDDRHLPLIGLEDLP